LRRGVVALLGLVAATLWIPAQARDSEPRLVALGKALFFEPALSADGATSCASCHDPAKAFSDGRVTSRGVGGAVGARNTPSLLNVKFHKSFFWDGRGGSLEANVMDPLFNPVEHGLSGIEELGRRMALSPRLARAEQSEIGKALAAYLRTFSADSAFDRYYFGGRKDAITLSAVRGFELFRGRAGCVECHRIDKDSAPFTDHDFHSLGIGIREIERKVPTLVARLRSLRDRPIGHVVLADPELAALGRFAVTLKPADIGKFRTPSLRNVAVTAPYMHDGSVATLEEAIDLETSYRNLSPGRARFVLTAQDRMDLVEFLRTLTSERLVQ